MMWAEVFFFGVVCSVALGLFGRLARWLELMRCGAPCIERLERFRPKDDDE